MTFAKLVKKRMFFLIIFLLMISTFFGTTEQIGINKTVGWHWDISIWLFFMKSWSWLIFGLGYGVLALLKYWTNKVLSVLHLILLCLIFLADDMLNSNLRLMMILNIVSLIVFVTNVIWAIGNRNKNKKKAAHNKA